PRRQPTLGGGAEQSVDVLERKPAIFKRAGRALRHQVDRRHPVRHVAEIGLGRADDRRAAARKPGHHAASAGTNTAQGGSSPPGRWTRKRTRRPIATLSGPMSSTRLLKRNPSL